MKKVDPLSFFAELKRKSIHLACTLLPLVYYNYLDREQIVIISSIISILFLTAEYFRFSHEKSKQLFALIFKSLLREDEKNKHITGATYLFLSATVTFLIFDKNISVPAVLVLTVSDSLAAIVGKMTDLGKFFSKSLSGSVTFFVTSACIISLFLPNLGYMALLVAALVTILEALPLRINDNILICLGTAIILFIIT